MSKVFRYSCAVTVLLFIVLVSYGQNTSRPPYYDSAWSRPYEPFRIAGNLYYVGTHDLGCYLIATSKGHVLINSGLAESAPMIRKSVETLGFKFTDIKILLTTQAHFDHVAGLAEIKKLTGAKMMVQEADAQVLADGGASDFALKGEDIMFVPIKADRLLHDGEEVQLGGSKLKVIHHPGHTKGSTSFLIDVKDETRSWKVLIANMPSILSETNLSGMPGYPNVGKDYGYTFESLKKLQFDLWVASHAGQFRMHDKRKPGDAYRPEVFNDRKGYDESVKRLEQEYIRRSR